MSFSDLLNVPASSAEKPKAYPQGTYRLQVEKFNTEKSKKKQTPGIHFEFRVLEAMEDVDQEELEQRQIDMAKKGVQDRFWLTEDSIYRLTEFWERLGLDVGSRTHAELLPESTGRTVLAYITETPSQKPGDDRTFNEISSYVSEDGEGDEEEA